MSRPERGQYGNTRGKPDKQKRRAENRARDPRYVAAMDKVAEEQRKLDALIEEQKLNPAVGVVEGALHSAARKERERELARAQREADKIEPIIEDEPEEDLVDAVIAHQDSILVPPRLDLRKLRKRGEDKFQFAELTGRLMLKAGYCITYVMEFTGLGYEDLKGYAELDEYGYGIVEVEDEEA